MSHRRPRQVPVAPAAVEIGGFIGDRPRRHAITSESPRPASRVTQWISRRAIMQALVETVKKTPSIRVLGGYVVERLLVEDGRVVGLQALLFQDGGLVVMGANILVMGVVPGFVGYQIYRFGVGRGRAVQTTATGGGASWHYAPRSKLRRRWAESRAGSRGPRRPTARWGIVRLPAADCSSEEQVRPPSHWRKPLSSV